MLATAQQFSNAEALWLGNAMVMLVIKCIGFLIAVAVAAWGFRMGAVVKNQRETIRVLGEIRDQLQEVGRRAEMHNRPATEAPAPNPPTQEDPAAQYERYMKFHGGAPT